MSTVGIAGFGLIGGSMGAAIKKYTDRQVIAIDNDPAVADYAVKNGFADEGSLNPSEALPRCDIVFLALYPEQIKAFIKEYSGYFRKGAVVADLCGVKNEIVEFVNSLEGKNFRFVGCHPMAGKEISGVKAADADLYKNASFIMTKTSDTDSEAYEEIKAIALKIGFGRVVETDPKEHDRLIAYTSQLPHVLSVTYVLQTAFTQCEGFYAGSFEDMARVGKINENLWTELFVSNKDALGRAVEEYIDVLKELKEKISSGDGLKEMLKRSRNLKEWKDENYKS